MKNSNGQMRQLQAYNAESVSIQFFRRPYRYFSIALKMILSLSDHYKNSTTDGLWIKVFENLVLSQIDITMATINKKI